MSTATKTPSHVQHQIAGCNECGWSDEWYKAAGRRAKAHTAKTGHKTWVETGTSYYYVSETLTKAK